MIWSSPAPVFCLAFLGFFLMWYVGIPWYYRCSKRDVSLAEEFGERWKLWRVVLSGFASFAFSITGMALSTEKVEAETCVISQGRIVAVYPSSQLVWQWQIPSGEQISYAAKPFTAEKPIRGITSNLSVTNIKVYAEMETGGYPQAALNARRSGWVPNPWEKLRSLLNRFDRTHHTQAAEVCYDDENKGQQARLQSMFVEFAGAELAAGGVRVKSVYFKLE